MTSTPLDPDQRRTALADLRDWRHWADSLHTAYECASAAAALALINEIGRVSALHSRYPDVDWRSDHVFLRLAAQLPAGVMTAADMDVAADLSAAAVALDVQAVPTLCRTVEIAIDAVDPGALAQPWATALAYDVDAQGDLADPYRRNPSIWFQQTATPNPSRLHVDVIVEDSTADPIVDRAVEQGARRIDDSFRPSFTVLSDAEDNRVCICTDLGRD